MPKTRLEILRYILLRKKEIRRELLIKGKANINAQNAYGNTPLHLAIAKENNDIVKSLTKHSNIETSIQNKKGFTPLSYVIQKNNKGMVELLAKKVNVQKEANNGLNLLSIALEKGDTTLARLLINKGAEINSRTESIHNPLHWAIALKDESARREMVALLINKGADLKILSWRNDTPLEFAKLGHDQQIINSLTRAEKEQNTVASKSKKHTDQAKRPKTQTPSPSR